MFSFVFRGLLVLLYFGFFNECGVLGFISNNVATSNVSSTLRPNLEMVREHIELAVPENLKMNDINDYREILLPPYSNTRIQLSNYSRNAEGVAGYALVQMHAFELNVTLSYNRSVLDGGHLTGQNVGLLMYADGDLYALNLNPLQPVWVSLVLMIYNLSAPVPGGCNLEFPVEVSPILNLMLTSDIIIIDTPVASVARMFQNTANGCGKARLQYESYYVTMPSHDYSQKAYFNAIRSLISFANAKASGRQNTLHAPLQINRHEYGRITGLGMVFVTVVVDPVHRGFALYVPTHTYSCQPFVNPVECYGLEVSLRLVLIMLIIMAAVDIIGGWLPASIKCSIFIASLCSVLSIECLISFGKPLPERWLIGCLVGMVVIGMLLGLLLASFAPKTGTVLCSFLTGYLILQTLIGIVHGNLYSLPYASWYVLCGATLIGGALTFMLPITEITRSVIFGAIIIFYGLNAVFGTRLDYPLRHFVRRLYVENYEVVHDASALDENDFVALASFVLTMVVCLFLRTRYQPDEVQDDYTRLEFPCHGSSAIHGEDDRVERSTVIAADDTAAYQRFINEQPIITRWTSGDDDVFESPESNSRFFRVMRRNDRI